MIDSWIKIVDPNFINAELIGTTGAEMIVTIKDIDFAECYDDGSKQKTMKQSVFFDECKPLVLNKTNAKTLKKLFSPNSDNPADAVGHKVILKVEKVKAFGKTVDAIRIKEYSETKCADCGKVILPWAGHSVAEIIEMGNKNCGRALCVDCMKKAKEEQDGKNEKA
jgi:hypothetical protein